MWRDRDLAAPSRRAFLKTGGALVIACFVPIAIRRALAEDTPAAAKKPVSPNAFIRIAPDESVTILLKHSEMGQGVWTSIPMVVAEELGCDWSRVRVEHAPAAPESAHTAFGMQMTGGSTSTWESFDQLRTAGAMAREMLVAAGAKKLDAAPGDCRAENGYVMHGERKLSYGSLAAAAAELPAPAEVKLKDASAWTLIGKPTRRLDSKAKVTGTAEYGIDVKRPDMVVAVVARSPVFGGKVRRFDATKAKAVPGVIDAVEIPSGVAVVGKHFWAAKQGREALVVEWDDGAGKSLSTAGLREDYRKLAATPGKTAKSAGDVDAALKGAPGAIEAEYEVPFLAHAPMEPLNCTVSIGKDGCDVWTGTQFQGVDQKVVAEMLGIQPEQVRIHTTFLGGGFGRRATPKSDFVSEAVAVAKATGKTVKVVWTREDDIRGGYYRPMWLSRLRAALGEDGKPVAWSHTIVGQSILAGTPFAAAMIKDGLDGTSVEGAADSPYLAAIPAYRVDLHSPESPVTVLWWRSVGHSHTAFVVECFLDELAAASKTDPLTLRLQLLDGQPRMKAVLQRAAAEAGWDSPAPAGRARGLALHHSFETTVAQVAEVSLEGGQPRVHRVTCAVDCGRVVNPDGVAAQLEGAVGFGLTAVLHGAITLREGRVQQSNFHDYQMLRMNEMPVMDVHLLKGSGEPGGMGEIGTSMVAPAFVNALFAATGKRFRSYPVPTEELKA